jgi:hypothetical protein
MVYLLLGDLLLRGGRLEKIALRRNRGDLFYSTNILYLVRVNGRSLRGGCYLYFSISEFDVPQIVCLDHLVAWLGKRIRLRRYNPRVELLHQRR